MALVIYMVFASHERGASDVSVSACSGALCAVSGHMFPVWLSSAAAKEWPPGWAHLWCRSEGGSDRDWHLYRSTVVFRYVSLASIIAVACLSFPGMRNIRVWFLCLADDLGSHGDRFPAHHRAASSEYRPLLAGNGKPLGSKTRMSEIAIIGRGSLGNGAVDRSRSQRSSPDPLVGSRKGSPRIDSTRRVNETVSSRPANSGMRRAEQRSRRSACRSGDRGERDALATLPRPV